jgi:hypothetical protein
MNFTVLLPYLLSLLGRGNIDLEKPIKDVIDKIDILPDKEQELPIEPIDVRRAQEILAQLGFDPGPADGRPGQRTRAAVRAYQKARSLIEDGLIGQQTWARLLKDVAENDASNQGQA